MLVHDYDDEQTLEEEEALSGDSCSNELDDLEKEGDMPLEDLLAMYGYGGGGTVPPDQSEQQDTRSSSEEEILSNQDLTLDKDEIARDLLKNSDDDDDKETTAHELLSSVANSQTVRLLRSQSQPGSEEDDESESEDADYNPAEPIDDWKKTIQVGSDFQASVPEGMCQYGDAPAYENEDRLLWDPTKLEDNTVENYLDEVHKQNIQNASGANAIPTGAHIRDDEQVKTRSVGELVHFYYLWKKTERHDVFANKTRLEKRKYALHPGVTRVPVPAPSRERSASPVTSLIYGDPKRNHLKPPSESSESPQVSSESKKLDVGGASPTVVTISSDLKRGHSSPSESSPVKAVSSSGINGNCEDFEPVSKKLKPDTDNSQYERQETYSDKNHVDSISSSNIASSTPSIVDSSSKIVDNIVSSLSSDSLRTIPPVPSESVV
ncbi:hypothetical protein FSP39_020549 [Pinctada imbricata]|uniref:Mesoderm induction early response protein 1 n=1 Tax=Pinctada imbricata TaxID=66713 RepID=A0AA88Y0N0_PINIB|nr:hypothetical protein FSP39_020549 [Pinctada imbricata]